MEYPLNIKHLSKKLNFNKIIKKNKKNIFKIYFLFIIYSENYLRIFFVDVSEDYGLLYEDCKDQGFVYAKTNS